MTTRARLLLLPRDGASRMPSMLDLRPSVRQDRPSAPPRLPSLSGSARAVAPDVTRCA